MTVKLTEQEMWDTIEKANNLLFDAVDTDVEHTLYCHADTLPERYRAMAAGMEKAFEVLQAAVQLQLERSGCG